MARLLAQHASADPRQGAPGHPRAAERSAPLPAPSGQRRWMCA